MVMVIMIIIMGSLVKDGELTETPNSDFPHRRRYLAQGAVKRHLKKRVLPRVGFYILLTSQVSSLMLKPTLMALGSPESSNVN